MRKCNAPSSQLACADPSYLEHCLDEPETTEEAATGKELRKEIKAQRKIVLRRAGEQQYDLELPEAERIARNEVLLGKMEERRLELVQARKDTAAEFYKEREEKAAKALADKEAQRDRDMQVLSRVSSSSMRSVKLRSSPAQRIGRRNDATEGVDQVSRTQGPARALL